MHRRYSTADELRMREEAGELKAWAAGQQKRTTAGGRERHFKGGRDATLSPDYHRCP